MGAPTREGRLLDLAMLGVLRQLLDECIGKRVQHAGREESLKCCSHVLMQSLNEWRDPIVSRICKHVARVSERSVLLNHGGAE